MQRQRLIYQWKLAIDGSVRQLIKERFEKLELNGHRVHVPATAPEELVEELHAELLKIDPSYDRSIRALTQLKKMPKLAALVADPAHVLNVTYCFETQCCDKPACECEYNCKAWTLSDGSEVPTALKDMCLKSMPMPMHSKGSHFLPFAEAGKLPATTEEHFPSKAGKTETLAMKAKAEIQKECKAADQGKKFNTSKVRHVIHCSECGRWRCIYSVEKPSNDEITALDCYKENIIW